VKPGEPWPGKDGYVATRDTEFKRGRSRQQRTEPYRGTVGELNHAEAAARWPGTVDRLARPRRREGLIEVVSPSRNSQTQSSDSPYRDGGYHRRREDQVRRDASRRCALVLCAVTNPAMPMASDR